MLANCVAVLKDCGTERAIPRIRPVKAKQLLPIIGDGAQRSSHKKDKVTAAEDDDWPDSDDDDDCEVDMMQSLSIDGPSHVLHGATSTLENAMRHYKGCVDGMKHICRLLRRPHTRERLLKRCFNSSVGRAMHDDIKSFKGHIVTNRRLVGWG